MRWLSLSPVSRSIVSICGTWNIRCQLWYWNHESLPLEFLLLKCLWWNQVQRQLTRLIIFHPILGLLQKVINSLFKCQIVRTLKWGFKLHLCWFLLTFSPGIEQNWLWTHYLEWLCLLWLFKCWECVSLKQLGRSALKKTRSVGKWVTSMSTNQRNYHGFRWLYMSGRKRS